jgi:hypothetical protein
MPQAARHHSPTSCPAWASLVGCPQGRRQQQQQWLTQPRLWAPLSRTGARAVQQDQAAQLTAWAVRPAGSHQNRGCDTVTGSYRQGEPGWAQDCCFLGCLPSMMALHLCKTASSACVSMQLGEIVEDRLQLVWGIRWQLLSRAVLCVSVCTCRAATARLDFSALDREVVADQVNKQSQDREVWTLCRGSRAVVQQHQHACNGT